jgi:hypothetical protein
MLHIVHDSHISLGTMAMIASIPTRPLHRNRPLPPRNYHSNTFVNHDTLA